MLSPPKGGAEYNITQKQGEFKIESFFVQDTKKNKDQTDKNVRKLFEMGTFSAPYRHNCRAYSICIPSGTERNRSHKTALSYYNTFTAGMRTSYSSALQ